MHININNLSERTAATTWNDLGVIFFISKRFSYNIKYVYLSIKQGVYMWFIGTKYICNGCVSTNWVNDILKKKSKSCNCDCTISGN